MNEIDRWFERTARREDRTVSLYASILTGRFFAYFRYRLRFVLLLDTTRFVVHVAEFLIILTSLGGLAAFTVMLLRVGSLIVSGAWWGLLEVMRERVRVFAQSGDRDAVEREVGQWLVLSVVVAVVLTVGGGVALVLLLPSGHNAVGHLYAFLVIIELALRFPVRVLHSGIYATRRIYRPLWSMFAPTAVQLLVIGVGVFLYPAGAIVIAIIASNAISIWITVHYTVRVYRLVGLWPNHRAPGRPRRILPSIPVAQGVEATLAGLGLRLDAVLVLAIVGIYGTNTRSFDLTAGFSEWRDVDAFQFFYLVLPTFRGAYDASSVFYFDFVRLRRIPALSQFRLLFFHKLLWTTPVLGLFFWSLAAALGLFVTPDIPFSFLLALLPLFLIRSAIGAYQIRLFAEGQFRALIASIALLAGLLLLVWLDVNRASDLVQITAAMLTVLIVHINLQHFRDRTNPLPALLSLRDWIRTLAQETGPVRVGRIAIPGWLGSRQRAATMKVMRQTFGGEGHLAFRSSTTLLFYKRTTDAGVEDPHAQTHLALQASTGGIASRAEMMPSALKNGREALDRIAAGEWTPTVDGASAEPASVETLSSAFLATFPDGIIVDLDARAGTRAVRGMDRSLLAVILPATVKCLEEGAVVTEVSGRWISPVFDQGEVRLIFILPNTVNPERIHRWRRFMNRSNAAGHPVESASRVSTH